MALRRFHILHAWALRRRKGDRMAASRVSSSSFLFSKAAVGDTSGAPSPRVSPHPREPEGGRRREVAYGKQGYDFIANLQRHGASFTEGFTRLRVSLYVVLTAAGVFYAAVWATSFRFRLTTDPSPYSNRAYEGFPSDYVVIENRWTGRRRVIAFEQEDNEEEKPQSGEENPGRCARSLHRIREKTITVNRIKDRLHVYQHKARAVVVVNGAEELAADRFVRGDGGAGHSAAIRRKGQFLFPDYSEANTSEKDSKSSVKRDLGPRSSSSSSSSAPSRVYVEAWIRPREAENRLQRGSLPVFEETTRRVIQEKLKARYFDALLAENAGRMGGFYAEELLRGGVVHGGGVRLVDVVPDLRQFEEEVLATVKDRLGDQVIVCEHRMRLF